MRKWRHDARGFYLSEIWVQNSFRKQNFNRDTKNFYGRDDYSIFDSVLKKSLPRYFNDITKAEIQHWKNSIDYKTYNDYITKKFNELNITIKFRKRKFDHFVWFQNR